MRLREIKFVIGGDIGLLPLSRLLRAIEPVIMLVGLALGRLSGSGLRVPAFSRHSGEFEMSAHQPVTVDAAETAKTPGPQSRLWRFLAGWRRWEAAMDYGPNEYTYDRLRALEERIEQLEQRLAAAPDKLSTPASSRDFQSVP